ncbi:hypothetical protein Mgra_00003432 [Meloidogyne graminicola]|uniref:Uncharacterized protein n=1 Tax=Meloidogyne graminicola TaxID=189291 RepID=A0A8S9ZV73_9BILA|nr:hypothetical protein Mgra_00003432 [Meloidogyne graminicola]
MKILLVVE